MLGILSEASWSSQGTIVFEPAGRFAPPANIGIGRHPAAGFPISKKGKTPKYRRSSCPEVRPCSLAGGNTSATGEPHDCRPVARQRESDAAWLRGSQPRYAPSGHLVYAQGATLMAVPFDPQRLEITGTPVPVVEGVCTVFAELRIQPVQHSPPPARWSMFRAASQANQRKMVWVNRNGAEQPLPAPPQAYDPVALSPDGRRVAVGN